MIKTDVVRKNDIIKELSSKTGFDEAQCVSICDSLVDVLSDALAENKQINWKGFFKAEVITRKQRNGINLNTGEKIVYPPTKSVVWKISKTIKDYINGE